MNAPLVVAHAGEEVLYVLMPIALILWLRNVAKQRTEREREAEELRTSEAPTEKPD